MPKGFQKGAPRHPDAGRKKGTPNRLTTNLFKVLEEENCDPFRALARIASNEKYDIELRVGCYKDLCQYIYPKRKSLEMEINPDQAADVLRNALNEKS